MNFVGIHSKILAYYSLAMLLFIAIVFIYFWLFIYLQSNTNLNDTNLPTMVFIKNKHKYYYSRITNLEWLVFNDYTYLLESSIIIIISNSV